MKYLECQCDSEAKAEWLREITETDCLFLDDIDKIKSTEGMLEFLFSVLDARLSNEFKTTIITTNLSGAALARRWGPEYGAYLTRRLREFSLTVDFH